MNETRFVSPEQEIAILKQRVAELESGPEPINRQEIIGQAIKEHVEETQKAAIASGQEIPSEVVKANAEKVAALSPEEKAEKLHEDQIQELLQIAREKGLAEAVSVVKEMDPYLLDHFHDVLVAEFQKAQNV